jgi:branched-chain amino acid transport system permease protein
VKAGSALRKNLVAAACVLAGALALHLTLTGLQAAGHVSNYWLLIIRYVGINVILAASLNLVNGVAGQFSIGHAGFMAVGAYASAVITIPAARALGASASPLATGAVFVAALLVGGLFAAGAGYVVGLPSLRLRGDYLAIVTLGFGEIIRVVILNVDSLGGPRGIPGIKPYASVFWIWLFVGLTLVVLHRIMRSDYGRALLAIREDETAAAAMGIDTTSKKVGAFTIAAFFAGIGGGLFAHTLAYLNPNSFTFVKSFDIVVMVILGGMGSLSGSVLAAIVLTIVLELLRPTSVSRLLDGAGLESAAKWVSQHDFRLSIYALMLVLIMLLRPHGLLGSREIWQAGWVRRLFRRRARSEAAS